MAVAIPLAPIRQAVLCREFGRCEEGEDPLVHHASCALKEGALLLQGRLFVFRTSGLVFYSNIFGYKTRRSIPWERVAEIREANLRHLGVFGTIEIKDTEDVSTVLCSFWARDSTLSEMKAAWKTFTESHAPRPPSPPAPQTPSGEHEPPPAFQREEPSPTSPREPSPEPPPSPTPRVSDDAISFPPIPPESEQLPPLTGADGEEGLRRLACTPEQAFHLLFANESLFTEAWRGSRGDFDIRVEAWRACPTDPSTLERDVAFRAPLESMRGSGMVASVTPSFAIPNATRIQELQRLRRVGTEMLILDSSSAQLDIPYGSNFVLETRLQLQRCGDEPHACQPSAFGRVRWIKAARLPFVKQVIEQKSSESALEAFRGMLDFTAAFLSRAEAAAVSAAAPPLLSTAAPMATSAEPPSPTPSPPHEESTRSSPPHEESSKAATTPSSSSSSCEEVQSGKMLAHVCIDPGPSAAHRTSYQTHILRIALVLWLALLTAAAVSSLVRGGGGPRTCPAPSPTQF